MKKHLKFTVVIEKSRNGYGAYVPDLPGVGVVGSTKSEVKTLMAEALKLHVRSMLEDGEKIPNPVADIYQVIIEVEV